MAQEYSIGDRVRVWNNADAFDGAVIKVHERRNRVNIILMHFSPPEPERDTLMRMLTSVAVPHTHIRKLCRYTRSGS